MLLCGKSVRIGAVRSVDWFLQPNWKILVEIRLLRSILTYDVAGDVIGLLVREESLVEPGAERHVVQGIGCRGQKPAHSRAIVEAVASPQRRKLIAEPLLRTLSRAVRSVACRANLRVDFGAPLDIGGAIRLLDLQRAGPAQLRAIGNAGGKPSHIGRKGFHLAALQRQRTAIHAPLHAAVDTLFERVHRALPPTILWELPPDAHHRHSVRHGATLQMTVLAGQVVAGVAFGRVRNLGADL